MHERDEGKTCDACTPAMLERLAEFIVNQEMERSMPRELDTDDIGRLLGFQPETQHEVLALTGLFPSNPTSRREVIEFLKRHAAEWFQLRSNKIIVKLEEAEAALAAATAGVQVTQ